MLSAILAAAAEAEATPNPLLPEIYDLIWSAVCFAIILFVWKFLPAIKKTLDARAEAIEGGIKKAEIAQAEAAAALAQYQDQLAEGRAEAAKIRDQARADGTAILNGSSKRRRPPRPLASRQTPKCRSKRSARAFSCRCAPRWEPWQSISLPASSARA